MGWTPGAAVRAGLDDAIRGGCRVDAGWPVLGGRLLDVHRLVAGAVLGRHPVQAVLVRRFSPEYRTEFVAWLRTDPFTNASAPAGPGYMPGFSQPDLQQAKALNDQASALFADGTVARETANKYVRDTVLFATVLFLIAVAQRFRERRIRIGANALALSLLAYSLISVVILPRA